jgi:aspartate/methionine/tyrosine aminotransferase
MKFSPLVDRIGGDGADAWVTHYEAVAARGRGEDVIVLSVGDPDLDSPPAIIDRAIERLRAGWLVGPRELAAHAEALVMCMLFGLPGFIQEAAITALSVAAEAEHRIRELCNTRRDLLLQGLRGIPGLEPTVPEAGMFMLVDVSDTGLSASQFMRALYERERVSVMDGAAFGRRTSNYVRICFATEEATIVAACARIRRFCEQELWR